MAEKGKNIDGVRSGRHFFDLIAQFRIWKFGFRV
jgi:hypothetical protein